MACWLSSFLLRHFAEQVMNMWGPVWIPAPRLSMPAAHPCPYTHTLLRQQASRPCAPSPTLAKGRPLQAARHQPAAPVLGGATHAILPHQRELCGNVHSNGEGAHPRREPNATTCSSIYFIYILIVKAKKTWKESYNDMDLIGGSRNFLTFATTYRSSSCDKTGALRYKRYKSAPIPPWGNQSAGAKFTASAQFKPELWMVHFKIWYMIISPRGGMTGPNYELPKLKPPWNDLGNVMTKFPGSWRKPTKKEDEWNILAVLKTFLGMSSRSMKY